MIEEIWKDVIGYENLYKVSNMGRVLSLKKSKQTFLTPQKNSCGYLRVVFYDQESIRKRPLLHRVVAEAFIPNPDRHSIVMHMDDDPGNPCVENLKWATRSENAIDMYRKGRK